MRSVSIRRMSTPAEIRRRALHEWLTINRISGNALSLAAGLSRSFVSAYLNGYSEDIITRNWAKLAEGASKLIGREVTIGELQGDSELPRVIEIGFQIGNGGEVRRIEGKLPTSIAPPNFNGTACVVLSDAGLSNIEHGDILFIGPTKRPSDDALGKVMVVQIKTGPRVMRRILPGRRKGRYTLQDTNPAAGMLEDQALVDVAAIEWIRRPG